MKIVRTCVYHRVGDKVIDDLDNMINPRKKYKNIKINLHHFFKGIKKRETYGGVDAIM